jgi:hypothetical protein
MSKEYLANLIGSSPGWITRALRGDANAHRIRASLASMLNEATCRELGLHHEWKIARKLRQMKRDMEAAFTP